MFLALFSLALRIMNLEAAIYNIRINHLTFSPCSALPVPKIYEEEIIIITFQNGVSKWGPCIRRRRDSTSLSTDCCTTDGANDSDDAGTVRNKA